MASRQSPRIQHVNSRSLVLGLVLSALAIANVFALFQVGRISDEAHHHHLECIDAANSLMTASDYLTSEVRTYVMTGDRIYAENYLRELNDERRRDKALETLSQDSRHSESLDALKAAFEESAELSETELYAMRLMADVTNSERTSASVLKMQLSAEDAALTSAQKQRRARELVLGSEYQQSKEIIMKSVSDCTNELIEELHEEESVLDSQRTILLTCLATVVVMLVLLIVHLVSANLMLIVRPMREHVARIDAGKPLRESGSQEVRRMVESYNAMYAENHRKTLQLEKEAQTDALTGLLNRGYYDHVLAKSTDDIALVLIDVDNFKETNDTYGHDIGDKVLRRVADCIAEQFRTTDYACRIGGDEFAVIMTKMDGVEISTVSRKLATIADVLGGEENGVPAATLSVGVAFSRDLAAGQSIYRAADQALYHAKENGRNRACFYER